MHIICVFNLKFFGIGCCDCLLCYSCLGMKSGLVDGHMTITHDIYRFFVLLNTWWNLHDWLSTVLYILIAPCSTTTPRKIYMIKGYGQQLSYVPSWKDYMYMEMTFKVFLTCIYTENGIVILNLLIFVKVYKFINSFPKVSIFLHMNLKELFSMCMTKSALIFGILVYINSSHQIKCYLSLK